MENGVVVPLLDLPALEKTPRRTLASKADFLRLLWGYVDGNFVGFRGKIYLHQIFEFKPYFCFTGIASLCCPVGRVEGNCGKAGGCVQQQRPCLLQLLKENWLKIEVELKSDKHILEMMKDTKQKFDKAKNNKKLSMEKKDEVVRLLKRTTFNLAAADWKQKALQDRSGHKPFCQTGMS